jgi:type I restriction-modification system DNA methylase subunit
VHTTDTLTRFNDGLKELREIFHKTGRMDDSNAKLDELVKLLCIEVAAAYEPKARVRPLKDLLLATQSNRLVGAINESLQRTAKASIFQNTDGDSLLGDNPRMGLAENEGELAAKLAQLVGDIFNGQLRKQPGSEGFEALNEAFGHFVRDNFRNNIEDAQYMTPQEVVSFACKLALRDAQSQGARGNSPLVVCDPSCGVGSFLSQFYSEWLHKNGKRKAPLLLLGQDKVDRMARLTKLNLLLFGNPSSRISRGNSVFGQSDLDAFRNSCDVIITNPPFGARFHTSELAGISHLNFPCLHDHIQTTEGYIDSEILFVDRYLSLLRPGGSALAILPDALISASGLPELIRDYLCKHCTIVSVTELPAVTFAQAGTRTKTCLLHFRKRIAGEKCRVFFATAKSVGFEVSSRKGVPYKKAEGVNELPAIEAAMASNLDVVQERETIHSEHPSCVSVSHATLLDCPWTPSHHSSERYKTLATLDTKTTGGQIELRRLKELVTLPNKTRRGNKPPRHSKCISVLHVGDFGALNIRELMAYSPKYSGQSCSPGDLLFSKINPRIPRAIVVPDLGMPLTCSTEFEVMRPVSGHSAYEIMLLLLTAHAQAQIQSLTSGTSSSHNRIKTEQLLEVVLPIPKKSTKGKSAYWRVIQNFEEAHTASMAANKTLYDAWREMNEMVGER